MSKYTKIAIVFTAIVLTSCCVAVNAAGGHPKRDELTISQFLYYLDVMKAIKLDNMLAMSRNFATQLLDSIPLDVRGDSAQVLMSYIEDANNAIQERTFPPKEAALMRLHELIGFFKEEMIKQEQEDLIIRRGLMGTFEFLARLSIEDRKFHEKFIRASELLRQRVSADAEVRFPAFFEIVRQIELEEDIVRRETLMRRCDEIAQDILLQLRHERS